MLHDENSMAADRANWSQRKGGTDVRPTCLLCRVLFPLVVEHRHLLFDGIRKQRRPLERSCAPDDSQSSEVPCFTTLREFQSMDHRRPEQSGWLSAIFLFSRFPPFS